MIATNRWALRLSVMALAISMMAVFWVWAAKTQTACAQATCPVALSRIISQGLVVNDDAADSDSRLEGDTNANLQAWDASLDSIGLGADDVAGAFLAVTGYTTNRAGVTSVGREYHAPAGTFTDTNAASTTLAVGSRYFIGAPTFAGASASQVITDAFTYLIAAPAAGTNMTLTRAHTMGLDAGTTSTLWLSRGADSTTAAGGLLFGLSRDTNLYRSAADTLRTDDDFTAANLTITSFAANWTNAGRTVADLGIVTTVDINGGTLDGVTIGGASAAAATVTTLSATGVISSVGVNVTQFAAWSALGLLQTTTAAGTDVGPLLMFGGKTGKAVADYAFGDIRGVPLTASGGDYTGVIGIGASDAGGSRFEVARFYGTGLVTINDTANTFMTTGLTIHGGGTDVEHQAWKNSDVGHAMTALAEADTFGTVEKTQALSGGLKLTGYKDADNDAGLALFLRGYLGEAADTTDTSGSHGVVVIDAGVTDGAANITSVAATGNVFAVKNNGSTIMVAKGNGDLHVTNTTLVALDQHDDIALIRDTRLCLADGKDAGLNARYGVQPLQYSCAELAGMGFVTMNEAPVSRAETRPVRDAEGRQVYESRQKRDATGKLLYEPLQQDVSVEIAPATATAPAETKKEKRSVTQRQNVVVTKDVQIPVDGQPGRFVVAKQDAIEAQDVPVDDLTKPVLETVPVMETVTTTVDSPPFYNLTALGWVTMDALRQLAEDTDASITALTARIAALEVTVGP